MYKKKSYGQHFLKDRLVVAKILKAADLKPGDFVVEVGPGDGALTQDLIDHIKPTKYQPILIEADKDLVDGLKTQFPNARVIHADGANVDIDKLTQSEAWIFVSNLPYNSANAILMNMLTAKNPPIRSVIMVQKEVGDKMLAGAGEMSLLSVAVQLYTDVVRVCAVKPGAFVPPPKVDSVVLRLDTNKKVDNAEDIIAIAKVGFQTRRKQLHRALSDANVALSQDIKNILKTLDLPQTARAQELSVEQWIALTDLLK